MDFETFAKVSVLGIPLIFAVMGLVEWAKSFKKPDGTQVVTGNGLLCVSMGVGLVLGIGYQIITNRPPTGPDWYPHFVYWFGVSIYGVSLGLVASGLYNSVKNIISALFEKLTAKLLPPA